MAPLATTITHDGESLTVPQWASKLGLKPNTIRARLRSGSTVAEALNTNFRPWENRGRYQPGETCSVEGCANAPFAKGKCTKHYQRSRPALQRLFAEARYKAKRDGIPFDITLADIEDRDVCPMLGIPLVDGQPNSVSENTKHLDRVIYSKGYVKGNVQVISKKGAWLKKDMEPADVRRLWDFLVEQDARIEAYERGEIATPLG